jgi:hypothetical protein
MTDNELRLQVALALGFDKIRRYNNGRWTGQHDTIEWGVTRDNIPDYPGDIAAAYALEESITTFDDRVMYTKCLIDVLKDAADEKSEAEAPYAFRIAHATPAQRCRAFLAWHAATRATVAPCPNCGGAMRQSGEGWTCGKCNE